MKPSLSLGSMEILELWACGIRGFLELLSLLDSLPFVVAAFALTGECHLLYSQDAIVSSVL